MKSIRICKNSKKNVVLIGTVALIAVLASLTAHFLGHLPCKMCYLQRFSYVVLLLLSIATAYSKNNKLGYLSLAIVAFSGFGIALFHSGIQMGLLPDKCKTLTGVLSLDDFEQALKAVSCRESAVSLFGIPLPMYNMLLFSGLAALGLRGSRQDQVERDSALL